VNVLSAGFVFPLVCIRLTLPVNSCGNDDKVRGAAIGGPYETEVHQNYFGVDHTLLFDYLLFRLLSLLGRLRLLVLARKAQWRYPLTVGNFDFRCLSFACEALCVSYFNGSHAVHLATAIYLTVGDAVVSTMATDFDIVCVAVSPDASQIAVGGLDMNVRFNDAFNDPSQTSH
jgi:hypothetical protein